MSTSACVNQAFSNSSSPLAMAPELSPNPRFPPKHVLVIDDDEFICGAIAAQLRSLGAVKVETALGGTCAVSLLQDASPFDLIVTDLAMPRIGGLQLTNIIAARQSAAAVVYISATGSAPLAEATALGISRGLRVLGALSKPLRIDDLKRLLADLPAEPVAEVIPSAIGAAMAEASPSQLPLIRLIDRLGALPHLQKQLMSVWAHTLGNEVTADLVKAAEQLGETASQGYLQIKAENDRLIWLVEQLTIGLDAMFSSQLNGERATTSPDLKVITNAR